MMFYKNHILPKISCNLEAGRVPVHDLYSIPTLSYIGLVIDDDKLIYQPAKDH